MKDKLKLLRDLSGNSKIEQQAVIEYLLLDIYNIIIEKLDPSMKSQLKSARNYLAHGDSLIDILYHDIHERIASRAKTISEAIDFEKSDDDFLMNVTDSLSKNPLLPKKGEWLGTPFLLDQVLLQDSILDEELSLLLPSKDCSLPNASLSGAAIASVDSSVKIT